MPSLKGRRRRSFTLSSKGAEGSGELRVISSNPPVNAGESYRHKVTLLMITLLFGQVALGFHFVAAGC